MKKLLICKTKKIFASALAMGLFCTVFVTLTGVVHAETIKKNIRQNLPEVNDPENNRNATKGTQNEVEHFYRSHRTAGASSDDESDHAELLNDGEIVYTELEGGPGGRPSPHYPVQ